MSRLASLHTRAFRAHALGDRTVQQHSTDGLAAVRTQDAPHVFADLSSAAVQAKQPFVPFRRLTANALMRARAVGL